MNLVLLDLEETLVNNWDEFFPLRSGFQRVTDFLKKLEGPTKVGVMSWAVWDDRDKQKLERELPMLEKLLGRKFDPEWVLSMDDWAKLLFTETGFHVERSEMFDLCKKEDVLFRLRKAPVFKDHKVFLIDDAVSHLEAWSRPDNNCTVVMLNVFEM